MKDTASLVNIELLHNNLAKGGLSFMYKSQVYITGHDILVIPDEITQRNTESAEPTGNTTTASGISTSGRPTGMEV